MILTWFSSSPSQVLGSRVDESVGGMFHEFCTRKDCQLFDGFYLSYLDKTLSHPGLWVCILGPQGLFQPTAHLKTWRSLQMFKVSKSLPSWPSIGFWNFQVKRAFHPDAFLQSGAPPGSEQNAVTCQIGDLVARSLHGLSEHLRVLRIQAAQESWKPLRGHVFFKVTISFVNCFISFYIGVHPQMILISQCLSMSYSIACSVSTEFWVHWKMPGRIWGALHLPECRNSACLAALSPVRVTGMEHLGRHTSERAWSQFASLITEW